MLSGGSKYIDQRGEYWGVYNLGDYKSIMNGKTHKKDDCDIKIMIYVVNDFSYCRGGILTVMID